MSNVTNTETGCDLSDLINSMNRGKLSVSTVATLWIVLFGLIITQKVFKYVVKPCRNNNGGNNDEGNNDNGDNNGNNNRGNGNGRNTPNDCTII